MRKLHEWRLRDAAERPAPATVPKPVPAPATVSAATSTATLADPSAEWVPPFCLHCEGIPLERSPRIGFWQQRVLPYFGYFPWECSLCRRVSLLRRQQLAPAPAAAESQQADAPATRTQPLAWRPRASDSSRSTPASGSAAPKS